MLHLFSSFPNESDSTFTGLWYPTKAESERLPDALIIGVRKAGTGALRFLLSVHPDIVAATKELHFFNKEALYSLNLTHYINMLPRKKRQDQILLEKTPAYYFNPRAPERIRAAVPNVKMLLVVRNPVTRMMSEYVHYDVVNTNSDAKIKPFEVSCSMQGHGQP